jgi:cell division protein FtsL
MPPLQLPIPGELQAITLFLLSLVVALLVIGAVVVGLIYLITLLRGGDGRIAKLESRVKELEAENEEIKAELEAENKELSTGLEGRR